MRLFWKIYGVVFISFVAVIVLSSYITSAKRISDEEESIAEEHRIIGSLIASDIERRQSESKWPFESLKKLSEYHDFIFWWIVREDGTIHLADKAFFIGSCSYDYFPQITGMLPDGEVLLNNRQNYGLFIKSFRTGEDRWTFWLGFSTKHISEANRKIILSTIIHSASALVILGIVLYFVIVRFLRPVKNLTIGAEKIGKGELAYRVEVESNDELGYLARSFNKMSEDLQRTTTSIDNLNREITERVKAEEKQRQVAEEWKTTFDSITDMVSIHDKDFKIVKVNKSFADALNMKPDEIIGKTCCELIHGTKEPSPFCPHKQTFNTGKPNRREFFEPRLGIHIEASTSPLFDENGQVIASVHIAKDITERKKAEQALQASEQRYRDLFENAGEGIVTLDLDGRITEINKLVEEYGFDRAELLGRKLFDFVPEYDKARSVSDFQALIAGSRVHGQMDVITPKGIITVEYRDTPMVREGEVIGVQAILTDITERKRAEKVIRESEEKFKSIFEHANDGVIYLDSSGNILDVNKRAAQMFGGPKQHVLNKHFTEIGVFSADEIPALMSNFEKVFAGEEIILTIPIKNKKGQEIVLECSASFAKTDDGADRIMVIARDITERKKAEEQITKLAKFPAEDPNPVLRISGYGTVIYGNKASSPLLKSWHCRVGEALPDCWQGFVMDALSSGQSQRTEVQCDDQTFSLTFAPVVDANYVNIYGHDITERKKAEEALRESEEKYRVLVENSPNFIAIYQEGTLKYVNKAMCERFGWSFEEMTSASFNLIEKMIPKGLQSQIRENVVKRLRGESVPPYEISMIARDGSEIPVIVKAQAILYRGKPADEVIHIDITDRKKAEESLWESQERYRALVENTLIGIVILDTNYKIITVNSMVAGLFKKPASDFVGKYCFREFEKRESVCSYCPGKRAIASGKTEEVETQGVRDDGSRFYVRNRAVPFFGPDGVIKGFIEMVEDITERKKTEDKLIEYQARLKAMASKMLMTEERERQHLAMGLHDEVCQKLVLTKLALESSMNLVSDPNVSASLRIVCEGIGETIEKADSLTFELSNPVLREFGFIVALEKYLAEEIQQKYGIAYELRGQKQLGTLQDEIKNCLYRVTRELLTNVVKHAHASKINVSVRKDCGRIYVSVQDNGVGFKDSEDSEKVSRTTRFGLFGIREQLEYLGGHLEIDSEPGRGTTATIVVPLIKRAIV